MGKGGGIYAKPAATINCASGKSTELMLEVLLLQKQLYFKQERSIKAQLLGCLPVEAPARSSRSMGSPPWNREPTPVLLLHKGRPRGHRHPPADTHTETPSRQRPCRGAPLGSSPPAGAQVRPPRPSRRRLRGARGAPSPPQPGGGAGSAAACRGGAGDPLTGVPSRTIPLMDVSPHG